MTAIEKKDRAPARCNECGNIYTVNIHSGGEVIPIGVPACRGCGGSEFTIFGEQGKELMQIDE